ncbi:efflux RND transporter periplasmic adaptor subunit [Abyssalbus ytuae]|uniref:Efflux RND transporter periplasmic adaptor subunit n=1 Tax=Abyssalbus ytuae TaxID=2926907 RepID=A0A9E6ZPX8_9FLAO|nr:efflux RND transporter periplasmic adaptor subunit [Abyssalbus ytuae]UOB18769.1 efflux RND transporter periplasmic adaptor subunit [Abyssalbus ytuae]
MRNKKVKIILGVIIGLLVIFTGYKLFFKQKDTEIVIETTTVKKGEIVTTVTATGTIEPITQVEVGTQVSGVVEKIYVDFNSVVKEGQLIAELDKANLDAALIQAQASYDNALNDQKYLQSVFDRQKTLYENQVLSKADYDEALYNLNNAKSNVVQRLSDLKRAKANLGYANIYSPIDGVVLSKAVDEGQTVAASYSTPTLFTIAKDLKEMQVEANVDEADIGQVNEGQRVSFTVDAYPEEVFSGTVTQVRLNPTVSSNVVTYTVVIKADNQDLKLKPGLTATISIYTLELKDVLTVEAKAINFNPDMRLIAEYNMERENQPSMPPEETTNNENIKTLWSLDNEEIKPVNVTLGASDGINIQLISGVSEGDKIIYSLKQSDIGQSTENSNSEAESPFMPKPPGRNKK